MLTRLNFGSSRLSNELSKYITTASILKSIRSHESLCIITSSSSRTSLAYPAQQTQQRATLFGLKSKKTADPTPPPKPETIAQQTQEATPPPPTPTPTATKAPTKASSNTTTPTKPKRKGTVPWTIPKREPPTHHGFLFMRSRYDNLPVYTEYRHGGSQKWTVLRLFRGDTEKIKAHIRQLIPGAQIKERAGSICVKGIHTETLRKWLASCGF